MFTDHHCVPVALPPLVPTSTEIQIGRLREAERTLLNMTQQMQIRGLAAKGLSPTEIKETTGFSYPTIRKYLAKEDFSPRRPVKKTADSILDPYKPLVAEMLEEDKDVHRKQRHTAKRIHRRLVDEHGFGGSYSTVQRNVKELRARARLRRRRAPSWTWSGRPAPCRWTSARPTSSTAARSPACTTSPSRSLNPITPWGSFSATRGRCACARA